MSWGLGLNFYVPDRERFITDLVAYVRENLAADGNLRIEQYSDSLSIGYETMYMSIYLSDYENSCRIVEELENVRVNFDMTCWLYYRTLNKYEQGVIDSAKILKYYLSNYEGDCVWDEEGNTVLVRRNGEVSFAAETTFPVRWSRAGEFYSVDYKVVYRGMEFKPREEMKKEHLKERAVTIYTYDINTAAKYGFSPEHVTYVKRIPISEADAQILSQVWASKEDKNEIYTNNKRIAEQYGFSPKNGIYIKRVPFSEVETLIVTKVWITGENKDEVIMCEKDIASFIENYPDSID